jgi:hypothetical protein
MVPVKRRPLPWSVGECHNFAARANLAQSHEDKINTTPAAQIRKRVWL